LIRLIVLDVDGCLSDGKITYSSCEDELKSFNVKDGLAIKSAKALGYEIAIITGRNSSILAKRAKELEITYLYQGIRDKATKLKELCLELEISLNEVVAIGDDLNDLGMLRIVNRSFAPADAASYILKECDTVLKRVGGDGAVREMIEIVFEESGDYDRFVALWE